MNRVRNALSDKDRTIWFLAIALVILGMCLMFSVHRITVMATNIKLHLPPDVSQGAIVEAGKLPIPTAYTYARYIWQNLNTWKQNGATEYDSTCPLYPSPSPRDRTRPRMPSSA